MQLLELLSYNIQQWPEHDLFAKEIEICPFQLRDEQYQKWNESYSKWLWLEFPRWYCQSSENYHKQVQISIGCYKHSISQSTVKSPWML